jgi:hypothetical protein
MMAWGADCSSWDDSVDFANIEQFEYEEIPAQSFVMTTWHEKDSLEEVFWYAGFCADHPNADLKSTLIVHISAQDQRAQMLQRFTIAQVNR